MQLGYYAVHVASGMEGRFFEGGRRRHRALMERVFWPRRKLRVRKRGAWSETLTPIFPGYVFIQADMLDTEMYSRIRSLPGFLRFLESNTNIVTLGPSDTALLRHFMSFGDVVGSSSAWFDKDRRIRVLSGPLLGMEGEIVRVDRRKGRAKVRLQLYEESFLIDFSIDILEGEPAPASGQP